MGRIAQVCLLSSIQVYQRTETCRESSDKWHLAPSRMLYHLKKKTCLFSEVKEDL